jgi:TRAP-type C4-dicarboxylate transport system permease small subunit
MRALFWANGWLVQLLTVIAVLCLVAMTLGITAEVIMRLFGLPSIIGLIELTEYGLFISTFFAAPYLLRVNEHIRVDVVMSRVDPMTARIVEFGVLLCIIAISIITGFVGTVIMIANAKNGTLIFKDLIFPQWWLDWIIPLTSVAMTMQAAELLHTLWKSDLPPGHDPAQHVPGVQREEMP